MDLEQRKFRADPLKLKRLRVAAGLTVKEFAQTASLDRTTVAKILRGEAVFLSSLKIAAERAFDIDNPLELLHPDELEAMGVSTQLVPEDQVLEWEIVDYLSGWKQTSNGLQYQLVKLRHLFLPDRFASGKCYELRHLPAREQKRLEHYLQRHVQVAELVKDHPNVAGNLTAAWVRGLWWVIDRWQSGETLSQRLVNGPLSNYELNLVMTGIAEGLSALHAKKIIRRELTPTHILLAESSDRPILTDLELAKLTDGVPSVSPQEWPDDPYRAIEVVGHSPIDERADIYSWGRIFVHAATGDLPNRGAEQLDSCDAPQSIKRVVLRAVSPNRSNRPDDIRSVLKVLRRWI